MAENEKMAETEMAPEKDVATTVTALPPVSEGIAALPTNTDIDVCIANAKVERTKKIAEVICQAQLAGYAYAGVDHRPDTPHLRRVVMDGIADYIEQTIALQCGTTSDIVEEAVDIADRKGAYLAAHVARVMLTICGR